jgi:hypothetical protein
MADEEVQVEEAKKEEEKPKRYIEDFAITTKDRFYSIPIVGRDVDVRIAFTVAESSDLDKNLANFQAAGDVIAKKKEKAQKQDYTLVETTLAALLQGFIRHPEDQEYVKKLALDPDPDSGDFIESSEIIELVSRILNTNQRKNEEESGKA